MISRDDIVGVCVFLPTPCVEGGEGWDCPDSVDLDATARMVEDLISAGVRNLATCGTSGENAALLWEEKRAFTETVVQVARRRVPVFAGATALGTKEVVRQMRVFRDLGADAAFVGLPLWQTPTIENAVLWYADLGEAVPDLPVMIYANPFVFKSDFPTPFWEGVARRAPTVVASKGTGADLLESIEAAGRRVRFLPMDGLAVQCHQRAPEHVEAFWSTGAVMGAEPIVALADALLKGDAPRMQAIDADLRSLPQWIVERDEFDRYATQAAKVRFRAAGCDYGPPRAPYRDRLPREWQEAAEAHGRAYAQLRRKYASD